MKNTFGKLTAVVALSLFAVACQDGGSASSGRIGSGDKAQALGVAEYERVDAPGHTMIAMYGDDGLLKGSIEMASFGDDTQVLNVGYDGSWLAIRSEGEGTQPQLYFNGEAVTAEQVQSQVEPHLALLVAADEDLELPNLGLFDGEVPNGEWQICASIVIFTVCYTF